MNPVLAFSSECKQDGNDMFLSAIPFIVVGFDVFLLPFLIWVHRGVDIQIKNNPCMRDSVAYSLPLS